MSTQSYGTARIFAFIEFIFYILAAAAGGFGLLILGVAASIVSSAEGEAIIFRGECSKLSQLIVESMNKVAISCSEHILTEN